MEDKFVKYSKLYIYIALAGFVFTALVAIVIGFFYGFSKLISSRPVDIAFELIVISLPALIFSTAYIIFFTRTKTHPSRPIRYISFTLFIIALCYCVFALGWSIKNYFTLKSSSIGQYHTFTILFLAGNVALLFIIAILQALTTQKEKDWMDRIK